METKLNPERRHEEVQVGRYAKKNLASHQKEKRNLPPFVIDHTFLITYQFGLVIQSSLTPNAKLMGTFSKGQGTGSNVLSSSWKRKEAEGFEGRGV